MIEPLNQSESKDDTAEVCASTNKITSTNESTATNENSSVKQLAWPLFIVVFLLGLLFYISLDRDQVIVPSMRQDKPLPEFSAPKLFSDDQIISSSNIRGDYWLLNVWGSWCVSCYAEHPFLMELQQAGVKIVGVNYKDTEKGARKFLRDLGDPYTFSFFDPKGKIAIEMGVTAAPETFLIDPSGTVITHRLGTMSKDIWLRQFAPLIEQPPTVNSLTKE